MGRRRSTACRTEAGSTGAAVRCDLNELTETIEKGPCDLKPDLHSLLVLDIEKSPRHLLTHVPRNAIRGVRTVERSLLPLAVALTPRSSRARNASVMSSS